MSSATGTTAMFEDQVARPDLVLQDYIVSLSPGVLANTVTSTFIRSIFEDKSVTLTQTAATCPLQGCALPAQPICPTVYT